MIFAKKWLNATLITETQRLCVFSLCFEKTVPFAMVHACDYTRDCENDEVLVDMSSVYIIRCTVLETC
jgi:hypothetical protein